MLFFIAPADMLPMSAVTLWQLSRASGGVSSRRSSSSTSFSFVFASGTMVFATFSSTPDIGKSRAVHKMLNAECATAMPTREADSVSMAGESTYFTTQNTDSQTMVPITLKDKWTTAALLAFLLVPMADSMAVMQVPMFCPIMIGIAAP